MSTKEKKQSKGHLFILFGIIAGVIGGALFGGWKPKVAMDIYFVGELFLHALLLMVAPLVIASMIAGVATLGDVRRLGGIGGRTIAYYMITTALSVTVGLILVNIVNPGKGLSAKETLDVEWRVEEDELVLPDDTAFSKANLDDRYHLVLYPGTDHEVFAKLGEEPQESGSRVTISAWLDGDGKALDPPPLVGRGVMLEPAVAGKVAGKEDSSILGTLKRVLLGMVPKNLFQAMADNQLLPLILFSLLFGGVLTTMGDHGRTVLFWFEGVNEAILRIIQLLMYLAPAGIFALIAGRIGAAGGWEGFLPELWQVSKYTGTVIGALLIHGLVTLPLILFLVGRRNPFQYLYQMLTPLITAFSTASSSATLPVTLESVEEAGVDERSASFVLPLGATVNMDGTALYEAVAAMFIAQMYGIDLGVGQQIIIFLTATLAAIGAAGIPEAGLVTMVIVLNAVGLPIEGISLILIVDWFLDRCRTTVNVWGDAIGAAVIDRLEAPILPPVPERGT